MLNAGMTLLGAAVLYIGAEWLVKGSAGLARAFGVRPLVVGLTVVAYGTSMPELVVSALAAVQGKSDIALGNVIGSNIANVGLILGVTALISPPRADAGLLRRELPALVVSALLLPLVLLDGTVSRLEGLLLLGGALAFTLVVLRASPQQVEPAAVHAEADAELAGAPAGTGKLRLGLIGTVGLALLIGGGKLFVDGATGLALALGISERVVGLTVVAFGTSLPEMAASIVAALRGHSDIAIGNVIGSNVFNIVFILGGAAALRPVQGQLSTLTFELAALGVFTLLTVFVLRGERVVSRAEGIVLLIAYAAFTVITVVR